jgi:AraC family transcriptional regulator
MLHMAPSTPAPLKGPEGLYTVSVMPRFLADSRQAGWAGAYFTDILPAAEGEIRHVHANLGLQRAARHVQVSALAGGGWSDLPPGVAVWAPGDEQHVRWRSGSRSQFLFVSPERVSAVLGELPGRPPGFGQTQPCRSPVIEPIFDALLADLAQASPAGAIVGDALIAALIHHLYVRPVPARADALARSARSRVLELIEARLAEALTLDELAATAGLGVRQFCRAFRAATGRSPHQYLIERRVEQAKLLIATGAPLSQVALQCGFADQSQLTRTFTRVLGVSPGRYRARR